MEPPIDDRDVDSILSGIFHLNANLAEIADDVKAIRLLWRTEMRKKRKKRTTDRVLPREFWEEHERVQRKLAERIAYYEARIAARDRGEDPDAATA